MTEKRTTKKAEPTPEPEAVEPEATVQRTGPGWPFEDDHYLSVPVASRRGHSEGPSVRIVQQVLGVETTGAYDEVTAAAVSDWQRANERPVTRVVDRETWEQMLG